MNKEELREQLNAHPDAELEIYEVVEEDKLVIENVHYDVVNNLISIVLDWA